MSPLLHRVPNVLVRHHKIVRIATLKDLEREKETPARARALTECSERQTPVARGTKRAGRQTDRCQQTTRTGRSEEANPCTHPSVRNQRTAETQQSSRLTWTTPTDHPQEARHRRSTTPRVPPARLRCTAPRKEERVRGTVQSARDEYTECARQKPVQSSVQRDESEAQEKLRSCQRHSTVDDLWKKKFSRIVLVTCGS
eukprot:1192254-Prorocentrum_minimum.AAC.2